MAVSSIGDVRIDAYGVRFAVVYRENEFSHVVYPGGITAVLSDSYVEACDTITHYPSWLAAINSEEFKNGIDKTVKQLYR